MYPTGFITDPDKKVQGSALYVEMKSKMRDDAFYQFFITPDGVNEEGNFVYSKVFKRRVTSDSPKKQWRIASLRQELIVDLPEYADIESVKDSHNTKRFDPIEATLHRLMTQYTLVGKPFFVEVSKKDLSDVGIHKTPIKVVYRIGQTRKALGFAEMFEEAK
jgi:hypothetical protein